MFGRKDFFLLLFLKLKFVKVESKLISYKGILNIVYYICNCGIFDFSVIYNVCSCRCSEYFKMIG